MSVTDLTARRLHAVVARAQVEGRLPSLVAGVARDGVQVWSGSHGVGADVDRQYRIGSITKSMTMVLVLQLRDEGRLDLADPVGLFLPDAGYADRTIRSLLGHSSGMQSEPTGPWWERSPGASFGQLAAANDSTRAVLPSGERFHYSNLGFALLGEIVGRLRGTTWWESASARILVPLGMDRTSYHPQEPAATGLSVDPYAGTLRPEPSPDTGAMAPAGQVWSTVRDLLNFGAFLAAGHRDVLRESSLREAAIPQPGTLEDGLAGGYGLGLQLLPSGARTLFGHTGSMPGFMATLFVDHLRGTVAAALTNGTTGLQPSRLATDLLVTLEECEPTIPAPWQPTGSVPEAVAEVLGVWHWGNSAFVFRLEGDEVVKRALVTGVEHDRFRLAPDRGLVGTAGYHLGETLHVIRRTDESVSHLECATFVYTRTPYDPDAPIPGGTSG